MRKRNIFIIVALVALISVGASWKVRSYLEDTVHYSGHVGQMVLGVRNDTLAALAGTDGDYGPFQLNAAGAFYTDDVNGADIRNLDRNEAVDDTGVTWDVDLSDVDTETGLTAGATYRVTSIDGVVLMGVDSVGAGGVTAADVLWVVTAGKSILVTMPTGETTIHYSALTEDVTAYFVQVVND